VRVDFIFGSLAAAMSFAASATSAAMTPAEVTFVAPPVKAHCEVHIWPSRQLDVITEGGWSVHSLNRRFQADQKAIGAPTTLLAPARQVELMPRAAIADSVDLPDSPIIVHETPLSRLEAEKAVPHAQTAVPCSVEVLNVRLFYEKGALSSRSVRVFGVVRRWDGGRLSWSWSGFGVADIVNFPPKTAAAVPGSIEELERSWTVAVRRLAMAAGAGR
jgi:hypothetical protein